jgi:hypothetical protein
MLLDLKWSKLTQSPRHTITKCMNKLKKITRRSMEMERRNDIVKLAAKKAAQLLEVDLSEAAHLVRKIDF